MHCTAGHAGTTVRQILYPGTTVSLDRTILAF